MQASGQIGEPEEARGAPAAPDDLWGAPLAPSPAVPEGAELEAGRSGRAVGLLTLGLLVLLPLAAIALGATWLWQTSGRGAALMPGAERASDDLAPAAADRERVAVADQGIDFSAVARGDVFPLREMSTSRQITENGEPVFVTATGARVNFPVLRRDDFSNPASGWEGAGVGDYAHGEYRLLSTRQDVGSEFAIHRAPLDDFQARLDARLDRPTTGLYLYLGFRFRPTTSGGEGYVFVVTPDKRSFRLERWEQTEGGTRQTRLIDDTPSAAILTGTDWNRLVVRAVDDDVLLLVNGEVVGRVKVDAFRNGGLALGVGKEAEALSFAAGDARFTNLIISAAK
jgi:hypothetical protein